MNTNKKSDKLTKKGSDIKATNGAKPAKGADSSKAVGSNPFNRNVSKKVSSHGLQADVMVDLS